MSNTLATKLLDSNALKQIELFVVENYFFEIKELQTWYYLFHQQTNLGIEVFLSKIVQYRTKDYALMEFYYKELYFFDPLFENIPDILQSFLKLTDYDSSATIQDKFAFFDSHYDSLKDLVVDLSVIKREVFQKYPDLKNLEPSVFYP